MQDHEEWEKGIEVHVKAVAPLHVLAARRLQDQVPIGQQPEYGRDQ